MCEMKIEKREVREIKKRFERERETPDSTRTEHPFELCVEFVKLTSVWGVEL